MQAAAEQIPVVSSPVARRKAQLCTLSALDGRTVAARRARELAKGFEAELGGTVTVSRRFAIERAAALVALAEDAKARRLAGDAAITLEDVVRVDNDDTSVTMLERTYSRHIGDHTDQITRGALLDLA
jgi:hypothetical protein